MIPVIPAEQKKYGCVKHFNKPLELRAFKLALYEWEVICYFSLNFNLKPIVNIMRMKLCRYFTIVFAFLFDTVAVLTYLCVISPSASSSS